MKKKLTQILENALAACAREGLLGARDLQEHLSDRDSQVRPGGTVVKHYHERARQREGIQAMGQGKGHRRISLIMVVLAVALIAGCASVKEVRVEKLNLCEGGRCESVQEQARAQELLTKLFEFLKRHEGQDVDLFSAKADNRRSREEGISFYVQGGPIPAFATVSAVRISEILYIDRENREIKFRIKPKASYLGIPVMFATGDGVLSIKSPTEIDLSFSNLTSWMVVGTSGSKFEWRIDHLDFDRGEWGAYWSAGLAGPLSAGGGSGYQIARFHSDRLPEEPATAAPAPKPGLALLAANVTFTESSGNRIVEAGEEVAVGVTVENRGTGPARNVRVLLSGSPVLVASLGTGRPIGDLNPGERRTVELRAQMPAQIPSETAELKVEVKEDMENAPVAEARTLRIAMMSAAAREIVEVISDRPDLTFTVRLADGNNNRILDGGETVALSVEVANRGEGKADDVRVLLSGNPILADSLGGAKMLGEIKPGEKKTAEFKTVLPERIPSETAGLRIEVQEGRGFVPSGARILRIAMRSAEVKETEEVISEVNVDDIPPRTKDFERKNDYALFIGIANYREKTIPAVKYAVRDAEIMAKYLERLGGIPRENMKILSDDNATKADIEANLADWLPRRVSAASTVFVYYAGHGAPDPNGREAYLVPFEGHPDYPSKMIPLNKLYEALGKLPAREVVVILDSCFSGAKGRSVAAEGSRPLVMSAPPPALPDARIAVLAASAGNQISSDYDKVRHGLFTYFLLRGMRGEAVAGKKEIVELPDLYRYVRTNVVRIAGTEFNRDQTPVALPSEDALEHLRVPIAKVR